MRHQSYSALSRSHLSSQTLTSILSGFSTRSSLPLMQTSNSRARIEGLKTFNLTLAGVAMSRTQDMRNTSQTMSMTPRYVEIFCSHPLSRLLNIIQINSCSSDHDAIARANTAVPGYLVNGTAVGICSRHSMIRSNGAVDLEKGEK